LKARSVAVVSVIMLLLGASCTYAWFTFGQQQPRTTTQPAGPNTLFMEVGGSLYFAAEISNLVVVPLDGNAYITNGSVTFYGVKFQMVCPTSLIGCPGSSNSTGETSEGIPGSYVKLTMSFPDSQRETVSETVQFLGYAPVVSNHSKPRAGVVFEYIATSKTYRVFLLVTPYGTVGPV
jgi:hypothetical protein